MSDVILVAVMAAAAAGVHRAVLLWIYRSWFRQGFAADAAFHLAVIRRIKATGGYDGIPEFLIRDEPDTYPKLFHRLAALFPLSAVEKYPYLPNAVIWVLSTVVCTCYAHYVGAELLGRQGTQFALVFLVIFLSLASNLSLDMNGLNYISLSERLLSRACCGLYFAALTMFMMYGDWPSFAVAVLCGGATLVSSMFGRQTIFFVTPLLCIFAFSLYPLAALVGAVILAFAVDRGYFWRGLRHMRQFSHAYRNHTKHSRYYQLGLSRFVRPSVLLSRGARISGRLHELENNEPTRLLFRNPEIFLMIVLIAAWPPYVGWPEVATLAATLAVYVGTSTAALRHYGEAGRYIEFALFIVPPLCLAKYAVQAWVPGLLWLAYLVWLVLITGRRYFVWSRLKFPEADQLKAFLDPLGLGQESTLFTVPFSLGGAINVRTGSRALMYQGSAVTLSLYEKFMEEIPYLKRDWKRLSAECGVTHIVCERSYLDVMKTLLGWEYDFSEALKIAESPRYVAYSVEQLLRHPPHSYRNRA